MNNSTILKTDEIDFLVSLPKKTNEIINILKRNIVLSEKHCLNFSSNHNNLEKLIKSYNKIHNEYNFELKKEYDNQYLDIYIDNVLSFLLIDVVSFFNNFERISRDVKFSEDDKNILFDFINDVVFSDLYFNNLYCDNHSMFMSFQNELSDDLKYEKSTFIMNLKDNIFTNKTNGVNRTSKHEYYSTIRSLFDDYISSISFIDKRNFNRNFNKICNKVSLFDTNNKERKQYLLNCILNSGFINFNFFPEITNYFIEKNSFDIEIFETILYKMSVNTITNKFETFYNLIISKEFHVIENFLLEDSNIEKVELNDMYLSIFLNHSYSYVSSLENVLILINYLFKNEKSSYVSEIHFFNLIKRGFEKIDNYEYDDDYEINKLSDEINNKNNAILKKVFKTFENNNSVITSSIMFFGFVSNHNFLLFDFNNQQQKSKSELSYLRLDFNKNYSELIFNIANVFLNFPNEIKQLIKISSDIINIKKDLVDMDFDLTDNIKNFLKQNNFFNQNNITIEFFNEKDVELNLKIFNIFLENNKNIKEEKDINIMKSFMNYWAKHS